MKFNRLNTLIPKLSTTLIPKLYLGMLLLIITPFAGFTAEPDTVKIPLNATVEIQWIAPADDDIDFYRLYFHTPDSTVINVMNISEWWTADTTLMAQKQIPLEKGHGFADMTAVDTSGNESDHSDPVIYEIYDPKPGKPKIYIFRVVNE